MSEALQEILTLVKTYPDPYFACPLGEVKTIQWAMDVAAVSINITLSLPVENYRAHLNAALIQFLQQHGIQNIPTININSQIKVHRTNPSLSRLPMIKNIIAIGSGKGGVGKSTTAVNLAAALQQAGAQVGILDADIYGPSQPLLLGTWQAPDSPDGKRMQPVISHGLPSMSIGYLIDKATPMIWRGPMVTSALQQLLFETDWPALDYLIIDLPPGTGDIQLTLAQKIPVTAAVIVTTPQDIALLDARKATNMFQKVQIPVLGIIENMAIHICRVCGTEEAIFGSGGGQQLAEEQSIRLLGTLPLEKSIRELSDRGLPIVFADPESAAARHYQDIALHLSAALSLLPVQTGINIPKVVTQK